MSNDTIEKRRKYLILLCLLIILLQSGYILFNSYSQQEKYFVDYSYKLFYGEWKITEFMGIGQHYRGDKKDIYIGQKIYYNFDEIRINDETVVEKPRYDCAIIPMDKWHMYKSALHPAEDGRAMLGDNEAYFVHVQVMNIYQKNKEIFEFGSAFYIVDEDELLLETEDGWYKMRRLNYLPDYPDIMRSVSRNLRPGGALHLGEENEAL